VRDLSIYIHTYPYHRRPDTGSYLFYFIFLPAEGMALCVSAILQAAYRRL
jgi:hypothetical protein